jgi:hypothetical protein
LSGDLPGDLSGDRSTDKTRTAISDTSSTCGADSRGPFERLADALAGDQCGGRARTMYADSKKSCRVQAAATERAWAISCRSMGRT